jgi:glycosyltransferase involved in cell wall biosynthesis
MRLSFIAANLNSGGAERVMSLLTNQFIENGYEVEFVFLKKDIRFYPLHQNVKIKVVEKECGSDSLIKKLLWMRKYIKHNKPDVIFAFRIAVYCVTLLSLLGVKVPVIASERNDPRFYSFTWKIIQAILLPLANHFVVQTQQIKEYFPKFIQKKTDIIFNPVTEKVFSLPNIPKEKRIISVGRLHSQKNQKLIIEAFARVSDDFPEWKLVIYGEGPERDSLESLVSSFRFHVSSRISLPGRSENIIDELNKSEIFAFSSDYEGMSNAVVEAFCVGLPIITTKVSGTEDIIIDGENGFLLERNDLTGMVNAMRNLMGNENLRRKMGENNKSEANQFKIDYIFKQWNNVLKKTI